MVGRCGAISTRCATLRRASMIAANMTVLSYLLGTLRYRTVGCSANTYLKKVKDLYNEHLPYMERPYTGHSNRARAGQLPHRPYA